MTPQEAAVNIRIAVRSADAFAAIGRITVALDAMATAAVAAETALVGLTGVSSALAAAMSKAAADGALLAKALSQMKGMTLARSLSGITGAATSAATAMAKAAVAADALFVSLTRVAGAATAAAAGLGAFTTAAKGAAGAATAAAGAAGGSGAARGFQASGAAAGAAATQMRALGSGAGLAARQYDDFGQRVRATSTRLDDAAAGARNINNGMRQLTDGTDRARQSSMKYDSSMRQVNNSLGTHDTAVRNSYASWDRFNTNLATGSHRLRMAGSQAQWTGRQLSMFFTAPLAIMGAIGVKSALDIEKAMVHLSKVYDGPSEDIQKFTGYFKALSEVMGVQQAEVTEIGATWAQVGAQGTELAKMTKLTTEAMVLGDMSAAEATQALIAVQAQYKLSAEGQYDANGKLIEGTAGVKETLAQLNIIENATGASMQDLTQAFQRSAASARIAGVDQAHLGAMIATLVPATGSAAKAGVALNSIFAQLGSPASKAAGALRDLGFDIDDTAWRSSSLTERLENIADQFVKLDNQSKMDLARPLAGIFQMPKAVQLLGDIAARNGDGLSYYKQALEGALDPIKSMSVYQKELNTVLESNPQKLKQAGVIIQNALVDAVIPIIPHIVYLAQSLAKLFRSFQDLSPVTQKWIMILLLALAAVGPLAMLVGSLAILFGVFGKTIAGVSRILAWTAFNILGLGTATKMVEGEMVTRTPIIKRVWGALHSGMTKISAGFMIAMRALYAGGMTVLSGIIALGGRLGLSNFSKYQALQTTVARRAAQARANIYRAEAASQAASASAGGAGAAAAGAGGAGAGAAASRTQRIWAATMVGMGKITAAGAGLITKIWGAFGRAFTVITGAVGTVASAIWAGVMKLWAMITGAGATAVGTEAAAGFGSTTASAATAGRATQRVWAASWTGLEAITAAGSAATFGTTAAGQTAITGSVAAGALARQGAVIEGEIVQTNATGLGNSVRTKMIGSAATTQLAITAGSQTAMTGEVIAGNVARTQATAAGNAGMAGAMRRGRGGMLIGLVSMLAMFPATIWKWMKTAAQAIFNGVKNFGRIFTGGATGWAKALENGLARVLVPIAQFLGKAWRGLVGGISRFAPAIGQALLKAVPIIGRVAGILAGVFTGPIGWAIMGLITLISFFPKQTWNIVKKVGSILAQPFINMYGLVSSVFKSVIGLVGRVWRKIVDIIKTVANDDGIPFLAKPFVVGVKIIGAALSAIPRIAVAVFKGVVSVIQKAGQAIYKAFSYMNPFAHHSPSLVENVTNGMAIVTNEFADASKSIQGSMRSAYGAINQFGTATAGIKVANVQRKRGEERQKIASADPAALRSYDALRHEMSLLETQLVDVTYAMQQQQSVVDGLEREIASADRVIKGMEKSLDSLQEAADAAGKALSAAQANLDKYVNAPIEGTRAMSDAIFANEMAQKKLRLEIMKMEDAGGAVDDVADKFSKLQGEIETLSGQRSELRNAGAGSDILGEYDKMIADLQAQQGAIATTGNSAIEKATKELEDLQRRGEMLDLENSLKFDPLNRQVEQLTNNLKEMPFEEKIAGVKLYQGQVDSLTIAQENANKAVEAQQGAIDKATAARDLLADRLDSEQEKLDGLTETHDQLTQAIDDAQASIDETISAIEEMEAAAEAAQQAADDLAGKMDGVTSATDSAADALDGFGLAADNLDDYELPGGSFDSDAALGDIDELTKGLTDDIAAGFEGIDLFGGIKEKFRNFKDWLVGIPGAIGRTVAGWASSAGSWFAGVGESIGSFFSGLPSKIGNTISGWASSVGSWFSGVGSSIGSWFGNLWSATIWPALQSLPGKIATFFMNLPEYLIQAFAYITGFMLGLVAKAFAIGAMIMNYFVGGGFAQDVAGLWNDHIFPWLRDLFGPIADFVTQTIPEFGRRIWSYFADGGFTGDVAAIWNDHVYPWISGVFNSVATFVTDTIPEFGRKIWNYFAGGGFTTDVGNVWNDHVWPWLVGIGNNIKDFVTKTIPEFGKAVWNYFAGGGFAEDVRGVWDKMWEWGGNVIEGLKQGILDKWASIKEWVKTNIVDPFTNGFKDALGINSPSTVMAGFGVNLIEGLWNGIKGMGEDFKNKLIQWVKDHVPGPIAEVLGIASPSKLMAEYGGYVAQGLANGITAGGTEVGAAAAGLANQVAGVDLGTISGPALDVAAPAAATAPATNPAEGMDVALAETTAATQLVWDSFDVYMDTALTAMELQFATTFTNINVNTVASVQMTSDQVIAITNNMQAQTIASTNTWATNLTNIINLLRDNVIATVNAMVNANITAFTMQRDQLTTLANSTRDNVSAAFASLGTNLTNTMASVIRPMFESFGPLLSQVTQWFADTVQNVGTQWSGIREPVAAPARFIVNDVYNNGIKEAWNKVNGFLGLQPLEGFVAGFAGGGAPGVPINSLSNPTKPIDISGGGALKAASSQRDSTLFAGMRGEYVLNKDQVKQWGGIGQLEAWRSNTLKGTKPMEGGGQFRVPGFEDGGRPGVIDEVFSKLAKYKGRGYDYGGGGDPGGYDCSGWTGAVHKILIGQKPEGRIWTTEVDFSSFGYKRGKDGYWSMGVHNGGGGMNSHTAGTLDGVNFESGGAHNTSTWGGPAAGTVHPQFENQYYLPNLGGVFKGTAGGVGSAPSAMDMMTQAYREVMDPIKARIPTGGAGTVGQMPQKGYDKFDTEVYGFLSKKAQEMDAANASMGNVSYDIAAGVEQWRGVVKEVLSAQGRPLSLDTLTLQQMQTESGGNPNAINDWDSNAAAGTPSKGLMQVTDPTFFDYRDARYPNNIWDPHANIAAALNQVHSRYGGPQGVWGQGHGYDKGGVLQPGITQAINASKKPEAILTAAQWSGMLNLAGSVTSFIGKIAGTIKGALQWGFKWFIGQPIIKNPKPPVIPPVPPKPPVTPPVVIPPAAVKGFWEDASQQMKTWTPDLVKAMEGVEGVVRNAPRIIGETVVSEWPTLPAPTIPSIELPEINLPPELVQPVIPPVVTTPTTPTTPGTGTGSGTGGSGTGTGTGVGSASGLGSLLADLWNRFVGGSNKVISDVRPSVEKAIGTLVPVMQQAASIMFSDPVGAMKLAAGAIQSQVQALAPVLGAAVQSADKQYGLTPAEQTSLLGTAISAGKKIAADNGIQLPAQLVSFLDSIATAQTTALRNTSTSTAKSATTSANTAAGNASTVTASTVNITININGDLSMPNVKTKDDAAAFLSNLRNLVAT